MLKKYSTIFSNLMVGLTDINLAMYADTLHDELKTKPISPEDAKDLEHFLTIATNMSKEMELDAAFALSERMWRALKAGYTPESLNRDLTDLRSRIEDQLKGRHFLFVHPARADYYLEPILFGQEVNDKFPAAIGDIEDAGKCLAVGQGTSTVLHLMRVVEVGLKALAQGLKIPYAPSWESYLNQIQTKISAKHRTKGIQWKKDEKFYRDVAGDLLTVKLAWRNPTMHVDRRYSVDEAEEIFKAVRALMQRLAKKLSG